MPCDIILAQIGAKEVDEVRNSSRGEVTLYFPARVVHRCVRIRQRNLKRLNNDLNFVELAKKVCPRLCELSPQSEAESRNLGQLFWPTLYHSISNPCVLLIFLFILSEERLFYSVLSLLAEIGGYVGLLGRTNGLLPLMNPHHWGLSGPHLSLWTSTIHNTL